ncbi:MAG: hypothetical protein EON60_13410 [Alphaproteobacteria bacterium]|nr:MAG: hypothetical protein EON60_13410 [Alphaproteobacteria bacterium]
MDMTLVHWSAANPSTEVNSSTFIRDMPLEMNVSIGNSGKCITLLCMTTDETVPHMMEEEFIMTDEKKVDSVVVGIPFVWDGFAVVTWIQTEDNLLLAFHQDPVPPHELYADYKADIKDRAMFLDLTIATI